ncbi:MAG: alkaline phosphatase PhoX [Acidobacteriota bacterium]
MNRRAFLRHAALAGGAAMATPFEALVARLAADGRAGLVIDGYGPLSPVRDDTTGLPLLQLPKGFRYLSYGWTGDPLDDGARTPGSHDGMAAFPGRGSRVILMRNHEGTRGPAFGAPVYDSAAGGGTTSLEFDTARGAWLGARARLGGTLRNCAGGPTPWGSWLTCEETVFEPGPGAPWRRRHGYVFEVPVDGDATAEPLIALGRFVHEAAAVDPATGIVYQTEDARQAGLYRFVPKHRDDLSRGGQLEMLAVAGRPRFDTRSNVSSGTLLPITWVPIDLPDQSGRDGSGVFEQGARRGGATFARLEGCTFSQGRLYVTATSGGNARMGQVWELNPGAATLRLLFESPGPDVLNMPDNACPSPRGGLVLCEDGTMNPCVHGLTDEGQIFRFARNNVVLDGSHHGIEGDFRSSEVAGATFSPDGQWLFFNVQRPGFTVAVTGPWARGLF